MSMGPHGWGPVEELLDYGFYSGIAILFVALVLYNYNNDGLSSDSNLILEIFDLAKKNDGSNSDIDRFGDIGDFIPGFSIIGSCRG